MGEKEKTGNMETMFSIYFPEDLPPEFPFLLNSSLISGKALFPGREKRDGRGWWTLVDFVYFSKNRRALLVPRFFGIEGKVSPDRDYPFEYRWECKLVGLKGETELGWPSAAGGETSNCAATVFGPQMELKFNFAPSRSFERIYSELSK